MNDVCRDYVEFDVNYILSKGQAQATASASASQSSSTDNSISGTVPPTESDDSSNGSSLSTGAKVGIGVGAAAAVAIVVVLLFFLLRKRKRASNKSNKHADDSDGTAPPPPPAGVTELEPNAKSELDGSSSTGPSELSPGSEKPAELRAMPAELAGHHAEGAVTAPSVGGNHTDKTLSPSPAPGGSPLSSQSTPPDKAPFQPDRSVEKARLMSEMDELKARKRRMMELDDVEGQEADLQRRIDQL